MKNLMMDQNYIGLADCRRMAGLGKSGTSSIICEELRKHGVRVAGVKRHKKHFWYINRSDLEKAIDFLKSRYTKADDEDGEYIESRPIESFSQYLRPLPFEKKPEFVTITMTDLSELKAEIEAIKSRLDDIENSLTLPYSNVKQIEKPVVPEQPKVQIYEFPGYIVEVTPTRWNPAKRVLTDEILAHILTIADFNKTGSLSEKFWLKYAIDYNTTAGHLRHIASAYWNNINGKESRVQPKLLKRIKRFRVKTAFGTVPTYEP